MVYPVVKEFEKVNAFFQASKACPDKIVQELDMHYRALRARLYDSRGNAKALSLVDFGRN